MRTSWALCCAPQLRARSLTTVSHLYKSRERFSKHKSWQANEATPVKHLIREHRCSLASRVRDSASVIWSRKKVNTTLTLFFHFSPSFPITGKEKRRQGQFCCCHFSFLLSAEALGAEGTCLGWGQWVPEKEGESWLGLCPTRPRLGGPDRTSGSLSPAQQNFNHHLETTLQRK